jgi:hypothetical protein
MSTIVEQTQITAANAQLLYSRSPVAFNNSQSHDDSAMQAVHTALGGSFDGRSASFNSTGAPPQQLMYNTPQHAMMPQASPYRSFPEMNGYPAHPMDKPQIYTVSTFAPPPAKRPPCDCC